MSDGDHPRCEDCRWWDNSTKHRDDDQDVTGLCRVNPPIFNILNGGSHWPFTEDTDWCASFSEPPKPLPEDPF